MTDSDYYAARRRSLLPIVGTILVVHVVFAFATFFLMYFFGLFLSPSAAQTVGSVVSIILFTAMMYTEIWRLGQQDHNLMNFGHLKDDKYRGVKGALISQIPGLILAILAIVSRMTGALPEIFVAIFKMFYASFVDLIWLSEQATPLLFILFVIPTTLIVHVAYLLGYKGYRISDNFYEKKSQDISRDKKF
jgi:hypothetical protein